MQKGRLQRAGQCRIGHRDGRLQASPAAPTRYLKSNPVRATTIHRDRMRPFARPTRCRRCEQPPACGVRPVSAMVICRRAATRRSAVDIRGRQRTSCTCWKGLVYLIRQRACHVHGSMVCRTNTSSLCSNLRSSGRGDAHLCLLLTHGQTCPFPWTEAYLAHGMSPFH